METLVVIETVILILLALLVAGLLRSHAEILRRLESGGHADEAVRLPEHLPPARTGATPAFDVAGTTLAGDPIKITVRGGTSTLLAFLSSGCVACQALWEGLESRVRPSVPGGARIVAVTKDSSYESPSKLLGLAPSDLPLVMSSAAWDQYGVQGSPYFIYVDGRSGEVIGEGTASGWPQVTSLILDAFADAELASRAASEGSGRGSSSPERARRVEEELRSAGIGPGHPSLYGQDSDGERSA